MKKIILSLVIGMGIGAYAYETYLQKKNYTWYMIECFEDNEVLYYDIKTYDGEALGTITQDQLDETIINHNL